LSIAVFAITHPVIWPSETACENISHPVWLLSAVIVAEDRRFFWLNGFDEAVFKKVAA